MSTNPIGGSGGGGSIPPENNNDFKVPPPSAVNGANNQNPPPGIGLLKAALENNEALKKSETESSIQSQLKLFDQKEIKDESLAEYFKNNFQRQGFTPAQASAAITNMEWEDTIQKTLATKILGQAFQRFTESKSKSKV